MSKIIRNVRAADITVNTPLGAFSFRAGASVELADDRADAAIAAGKWYINDGDLTVEDVPAAPDAQAEAAAKAQADAQAKAAEDAQLAAEAAAAADAQAQAQTQEQAQGDPAPADGEQSTDQAPAKKKGK